MGNRTDGADTDEHWAERAGAGAVLSDSVTSQIPSALFALLLSMAPSTEVRTRWLCPGNLSWVAYQ